jgi:hypothetical protein
MRTLAITQNITVDGSIEMLGDWFDPQSQGRVDTSGGLCGLIYAAARQARIKVWAAMVAAVLVSRPQKV